MFDIISNVYSKLDEKRCTYITYIYIHMIHTKLNRYIHFFVQDILDLQTTFKSNKYMHYIFLEYKGQTAELDVMCECYSHRTKQFLEAYRSHLLDTISCSCLLVETSQWVDSRATHKCVTANGCFPVKFRIHSCHEDSTHVYDL